MLDSVTEYARRGVLARSVDGDAAAVGGRPSWRWIPRCTRCGRWIAPPGGEGFGGGEIWCGPCVLRHIQWVASQEGR